jgi:tRNA threonylcarbamoyladenosine biosynthesis protein TsaB
MVSILAIETATDCCSVAIVTATGATHEQVINPTQAHASHLNTLIAQCLKACELRLSDLGAVAVSIGPGSYTGLRIGLSAAKALAYSLDIPLIAIDTLEAMQQQALKPIDRVVGLIDARHGNVYLKAGNAQSCFFEINKENLALLGPDKCYFVGAAAGLLRGLIDEDKIIEQIVPSAKAIAAIALDRFEAKRFDDIAYTEPNYIKPPNITVSTKNK